MGSDKGWITRRYSALPVPATPRSWRPEDLENRYRHKSRSWGTVYHSQSRSIGQKNGATSTRRRGQPALTAGRLDTGWMSVPSRADTHARFAGRQEHKKDMNVCRYARYAGAHIVRTPRNVRRSSSDPIRAKWRQVGDKVGAGAGADGSDR